MLKPAHRRTAKPVVTLERPQEPDPSPTAALLAELVETLQRAEMLVAADPEGARLELEEARAAVEDLRRELDALIR